MGRFRLGHGIFAANVAAVLVILAIKSRVDENKSATDGWVDVRQLEGGRVSLAEDNTNKKPLNRLSPADVEKMFDYEDRFAKHHGSKSVDHHDYYSDVDDENDEKSDYDQEDVDGESGNKIPLLDGQRIDHGLALAFDPRYRKVKHHSYKAFDLVVKDELQPHNCVPATKIGFIKIHKVASSTVQNILLRYALSESLDVVLPAQGWSFYRLNPVHFSYTHKFFTRMKEYDIFALHSRFHVKEIRSLLGDEKTSFVTILRHPVTVFESSYAYYKLGERLYNNMTLAQYIHALDEGKLDPMERWYGIGLNQQCFDISTNIPVKDNLKYTINATHTIDHLEKNFPLVMLAERMEESLVLLAHQLCLPLFRMATFVKNARKEEEKNKLTPEQSSVLEKFQSEDMRLYRHFEKIFAEKVKAFGEERMASSVEELQKINEKIMSVCDAETAGGKDKDLSDTMKAVHDVVVFKVSEDIPECQRMAYSEKWLTATVREKQFKKYLELKRNVPSNEPKSLFDNP